MINYIRNILILIAAQSLLIQYSLNYSLVFRLGIEQFTFAECFMYVTAFTVLTFNTVNYELLNYSAKINKILFSMATMQFNFGSLIVGTLVKKQNSQDHDQPEAESKTSSQEPN